MIDRLKKICARITIQIKNQLVGLGSGVIIEDNDEFYVLTANHCIYGSKNENSDIGLQNIKVEIKLVDGFKELEVIEICENNLEQDWALLKLKKNENIAIPHFLEFGHNFVTDEPVRFIGYQNINKNECRHFEAKVISPSNINHEFIITLENKTFDQGGESSVDIAKGLSGGGVFILRTEKAYLVGTLKSVIGEGALNDDIKCCGIKCIEHKVCRECLDLDDSRIWKEWLTSTNKVITDDDVDRWILESDKYFENLMRKSNTIYSSDKKAKEVARERILDFLEQEYRNDRINCRSDLLRQFEETANFFEKQVKEDYSRNVQTSNEAKDLLISLQKNFADHIKDLIKDKSNKYNTQLARNKVTWWLMNCSLDFKE